VKESEIEKYKGSLEEGKFKLHEQYKEYLELHDSMAKLEKEAIEGSGAARKRADVLAQNLDRMSRDFDNISKQLITSQERTRQLEFEISSIISQFNDTGDGKHRLQKEHDVLTVRFTDLDARYTKLFAEHEDALKRLENTKNDLTREMHEHETTRAERDSKVAVLTARGDDALAAKARFEGIVARLKSESEKIRTAAIELRSQKTDLESRLAEEKASHISDVATLKESLETVTSERNTNQSELSKVSGARDRLQAQVNDYRNSLDREKARSSHLEIEIKTVKKAAMITKEELESQIAALTQAKQNLSSDKQELMEKLSQARHLIIEKQLQYTDIETRMEELSVTKEEEISNLSAEIESKKMSLSTLTSQYTSLVGKHKTLVGTHETVQKSYDDTKNQLSLSQKSNEGLLANVRDLEERCNNLNVDLNESQINLQLKSKEVDQLQNKIEERDASFAASRTEWKLQALQHEDKEESLTRSLRNLREQLRGLELAHEQLIILNSKTKQDLARTRNALLDESAARSLIEMAVDDLRSRYDAERHSRAALERTQNRLESKVSDWVDGKIEAWVRRETAWEELDEWMRDETSRLDDIIAILDIDPEARKPKEEDEEFTMEATLSVTNKRVPKGSSARRLTQGRIGKIRE
jgi:chromosome segregation ATPase